MKRFMESRELDSICHITRRRHLKNKCLLWIWCQSGTAWAGTLMVQLFEGPAKVDWYIYASQQVLINMLLFQLFCFFWVCNWHQFQKDVTFYENKCYVFSNTQRLFKWSANHCAVFFLTFYTAAQFFWWGGGETGFYFTCHISFHRQLLKINMLPPNRFVNLHAGQLYFLCLFLFSLHSVADQMGVGPVTCQRNVPALPSISSSTRSGRAVARCRPQRAFGAAAPYLVNQLECSCASVCVCVCRAGKDQHTSLHSCMFTRHRRRQRFHHVTRHVLPCFSGLCDVCGLDRAFQRVHHQAGRKRGIWHVSTGIPVTREMCPAGT